MSTVYSIAGHNIQDFGKNPRDSRNVSFSQSLDNKSKVRGSQLKTKKFGDKPVDEADLVQSYAYDNDFTNMDTKTVNENQENEEDIMYEPQDLGADYFTSLQERYREQNQIPTSDHKVLFDFWKQLRKREQIKKQGQKDEHQMAARMHQDMTDSQAKRYAEIMEKKDKQKKKWEAILQSNQQDVEYTLKIHASESKKELTMSQFFQKRQKEIQSERRRSKIPDQEQRLKSQSRLYQNKKKPPEYPEDIKKREKEEKKLQKEREKDVKWKQQQRKLKAEKDRTEFVNDVIKAYKQHKEENYDDENVKDAFRNVETLQSFYKNIDANDKRKYGLAKYDDIAESEKTVYFDKYFRDRGEALVKLHYLKQGYSTSSVDDILKVWENKTTQFEKEKYHVDFEEKQNVRECLDEYFKQLEKEQREEKELQDKLQEEDRVEKEERTRQIQDNLEKTVTNLAKPKDRLKLGKDILYLKKMFPKDKFLRKLIIEEFQNTRLAKYPEEYDVYDSDEENNRKERYERQKGGQKTIKQLEEPMNKKEGFIKELFEKKLEDYKEQKEKQMQQEKQKEIKEFQDEIKLNKFLNQKAKEFIQQRQKRFEDIDKADNDDNNVDEAKNDENAFTLKKFLSKTFIELKKDDLKEITLKKFPDKKYGESKKLKQRSFPTSFKRHFFVIVKQYLREQGGVGGKDSHKKLPFWAPGGDGNRCRIHDKIDCPKDCKYVTNNKKIWELMRNIVKQKKRELLIKQYQKQLESLKGKRDTEDERDRIESDMIKLQREQDSAWVDEKFKQEKKNILMTNSDIEHCTFMPDVRNRREGRTFEKWVEDWGEDFKRKNPRIYKLGVLKQCNILMKKKKYLETYSKLRETFNVEDIKQHFMTEEGKKYKMIDVNSMYVKGKDDPEKVKKDMPNENFENKANKKILQDVYTMITFLENYEKNIIRQKEETIKMIQQDPFAPVNPLQTKSMMNLGQGDKSDFNKSGISMNTAFTTYAQRRQQVKSYMCPLGKNCPRVLAGRWPQSEVQSIVPLGAQCEFAHTYAELKFEQELKSKKNMLKTYMKTLATTKDPKQATIKSWNPAGNTMVDCKGCTLCAVCKYRAANLKRIADLKAKKTKDNDFIQEVEEQIAKNTKEENDSQRDRDGDDGDSRRHKKKSSSAMMKFVGNLSKQFQNVSKKKEMQYKAIKKQEQRLKDINKQKKVSEETLNKKISSLQKANTLYAQERFSEAFKIICRAVEIVKKEMDVNQKKEKELDQEWRQKLGLQPDQEITPEIVYQTLNNTLDSAEQEANAEVLYLYAQKRGIIGKKAPDVNQFLNIQIEETYLKIEKKLTDKEKDIQIMKQKIERLENEEDGTGPSETRKKDDINHKELCPNIKALGHCPDFDQERQLHIWQNKGWGDLQGRTIEKKCKYAHKPLEIYLENNEQKVNNLNKSIKKVQDEIVQSNKPQPYRPPSAQTVILSVDEWQQKERERELGKSGKVQKKKIDKAHREVIWEKPVEELTMPIQERPRKQN